MASGNQKTDIMRKVSAIIVLSVFLSLVLIGTKSNAQIPMEFHGYLQDNPVLTKGPAGDFDENWVFIPYAFKHEGVYYLYYSGFNYSDVAAIGLATSTDGFNYVKYEGNPVLAPSASGFDALLVNQSVVIQDSDGWVMYYNAREEPSAGPGPYVGRATADNPYGPWTRGPNPVLSSGSQGEWDAAFVLPNNVFFTPGTGYVMYYSGADVFGFGYYQIGMATSPDGINWTKYNDPLTSDPPFAESDPVLPVGPTGAWDDWTADECCIMKHEGFYDMYYSGQDLQNPNVSIGYAWSYDGFLWEKEPANPVFTYMDDEYALFMGNTLIEVPSIILDGDTALMYYDYGAGPSSEIAMATAVNIHAGTRGIKNDERRITNYPNPFHSSTTLRYTLNEPADVTLQIINSLGQVVATLTPGIQAQGEQQVTWDAGGLPVGVYTCRIFAGRWIGNGEMVKY